MKCDICMKERPTMKMRGTTVGITDTLNVCSDCGHWTQEDYDEQET